MANSQFPFPAAAELRQTLHPPTSRYHGLEIKTYRPADGAPVAYLARRFVPSQDQFATLSEHLVVKGDRPDLLAHRYLSDPEQFWRLCDANNDLDPLQLTAEIGRRIRVTLPAGIPGTPHA